MMQQQPQQLTFQQQQQFFIQQHQMALQQQYLMQIQQAQFLQQSQQTQSKPTQLNTDEVKDDLASFSGQFENIKVKRIPNKLKNLKQSAGSKVHRLAFAKSIIEDENAHEFEPESGQVFQDANQSI